MPIDVSRISNVLILRTDHLGDLLLSTPLIRRLRSDLPGRRFALVTSPANSGVLTGWDAIDEEHLYDPAWSLPRKREFVRELRQTRWDLCLTLAPRTRAYALGWLSGAPRRTGLVYSRRVLVRLCSPLWLTHPVIVDSRSLLDAGEAVLHEVRQMALLAGEFGLPEREPGPLEFPLAPAEIAWAEDWLAQRGGADALIGLHGAHKWLSGGWTAADFIQLVRLSARLRPDAKVLVTFGPADTALQTALGAALAVQPEPGVLLAPQQPVARWAALLSCCDVIISPDTGSLHLAAALDRPVVAMYESEAFLHCSRQWEPWKVPHAIARRATAAATLPVLAAEALRLLDQYGPLEEDPDAPEAPDTPAEEEEEESEDFDLNTEA